MRSIVSRRSEARGQVLALFAFAAVALILVIGLVIDGGTAMLNRRDGQNAADLSAMAGVRRLADYYVTGAAFSGSDNVYTDILDSMNENNCPTGVGSICSWSARYVGVRTGATYQDLGPVLPGDLAPPGATGGQKALGVKVDVTRVPGTYFLGVISQSAWTVNTAATAVTGKLAGAPEGNLLPIAFIQNNPAPLTQGNSYALTSGSNGPGNFGWLSWDGSNSAGALATSLCEPNNPAFTLPAEFPGDPGKTNASDVRACLDYWEGLEAVVLIPIVYAPGDPNAPPGCDTGGNGNNFTYCIHSIGTFILTAHAQPAVDQINAIYQGTIPWSANDNVPGPVVAPPGPNDLSYWLGLTQ